MACSFRLTHVRCPVKSTAVFLVEGINIGPLRQQQIDHLSRKGTGETKKFKEGKMASKKEKWLRQSQWVPGCESVVRQLVCLTLYNILLNTIQDDSSTKTNAWSQFRKWAWKGVRGRILLEHLKWFEGSSVHLNPQECVNEVLGMDKMNKIYCWYPFIYLLNWGMWIISKILMLCFTNSHATVCRYTKMHGRIKNGDVCYTWVCPLRAAWCRAVRPPRSDTFTLLNSGIKSSAQRRALLAAATWSGVCQFLSRAFTSAEWRISTRTAS